MAVSYLDRTAAAWYTRGKRRCAPSAERVLSTDTRPPVVYLRPFQDDSFAGQGVVEPDIPGPHPTYLPIWVPETEEEQLAQVMNEIGPFVAVGRPGETLPHIGAARMYLEHDEWKDDVLRLISSAKLVVLRAGETGSFLWEFEAVLKHVAPEKIVVLIPFEAPQYHAFRVKVQRVMPNLPFHLPLYFGKLRQRSWVERFKDWMSTTEVQGSIRGILYFTPRWECHFLELRGFGGGIANPLARAFKITLEPVFQQLGVPWKKPGRSGLRYKGTEAEQPKTNDQLTLLQPDKRVVWKLPLFLIATVGIGLLVYTEGLRLFGPQRGVTSPQVLLFLEAGNFALVFGLTWLLSLAEKTPFAEYGLPLKEAFKTNFSIGFLLGLAEASVLVGLIAMFGGYSFGALAQHGHDILKWGFLQLVGLIFAALYEEFLFRGYLQRCLSRLVGFWPAGVVLSVGFGALHLSNQGEDWVGVVSLVVLGLLFVFTLKRTGNLWYAVGLHGGFDWAQSFVYSVPDSGELISGHLSDSLLHGPKWLTGGSVGPEGSVFCFLTMGLQFLVVRWLFPAKKSERAAEAPALEG
jgi:membrane protease YdiL (CAAX protease family)